MALFTSTEFLAITFDASGATTGVLTVPFILSLAIGASALNKDSKASEKDGFGLVVVTSTGAIISLYPRFTEVIHRNFLCTAYIINNLFSMSTKIVQIT